MRKWQDRLAPHGLGVHSSTDGSEEGRGGGRGGGRLTSNAGALTSMWLTTWSSRFTLWSGTLGRSKTALTQYWILPYFPVNEVTKGLKRTKEVNWEVHLSVKHYWKSTLKVLVWVKKKKKNKKNVNRGSLWGAIQVQRHRWVSEILGSLSSGLASPWDWRIAEKENHKSSIVSLTQMEVES